MYSYNEIKNKVVTVFVVAVVISLITAMAFAAIFALVMAYLSISPDFSALFSTLSYILGCFTGGIYIGFKLKKKGIIFGSGVGACVFIISLIIALIVNDTSISFISLFHLLGCVLAGAIGGIVAVNKVNSKKYNLGKYK